MRSPGERWWTLYGDPTLDRLVEEALINNQDLVLATARVDEARALARVVDSLQFPAVDATFQRDRSRSSARSAIPLPPSVPLERNDYRAQLNVSYEVDLGATEEREQRRPRQLAGERGRARDGAYHARDGGGPGLLRADRTRRVGRSHQPLAEAAQRRA